MERVIAVALRDLTTGAIWSAKLPAIHCDLAVSVPGLLDRGLEHGFLSSRGQFLSRAEAERIVSEPRRFAVLAGAGLMIAVAHVAPAS
jgi:hypothetical protein